MSISVFRSAVLSLLLTTLSLPVPAQLPRHDLPIVFRSLAGVALDRDSASSILAKLGPTRERRIGTGHDVYESWCYVIPRESPTALLELMSDASDMGTPGRELNVIRVRESAPVADREACAPLRTSPPVSTPGGLRLGLGTSAIRGLLGQPTRSTPDSLIYDFDAKEYLRPGTPAYEIWNTPEYRESCFNAGPPYANVAASVIVVLRDRRAAEIRIERYDQAVC